MLVYGDRREPADPRERLDAISARLRGIAFMGVGIERHSMLVGALIEAGQLLQGVADEGCETAALDGYVLGLAKCVLQSWDSGFAEAGVLPSAPAADLPERVELRLPEGFAFYSVYPEAYAEAARKLRLSGPARVIGIRSIGTALGSIVAAALGTPAPITVRPYGDPFARQVELPADAIDADAHYVIVDEGPGLSGSSFGAVADALGSRGVPLERIAFLPSHAGDLGPHSSEAHRARWARAQRIPGTFDPAFLAERFGPLERFSAGGPWQRQKYMGRHQGERVLIKFAGLGAIGERKVEMARALHAAGFTPEPLDLVHGFLVERWCGEAQRLRADEKPIEEIGRYIGARARLFPAEECSGAGAEELLAMCRRNVSLALGESATKALDHFDIAKLPAHVRRVRTDNKLDHEEWLRLADGRLLKTDALDHHQGHDLVGCQPIEWDIAGAAIEFDLNGGETERLIAATGQTVDAERLGFHCVAYAAFRMGQATLAASGTTAIEAYRRAVHRLLQECTRCATPQES